MSYQLMAMKIFLHVIHLIKIHVDGHTCKCVLQSPLFRPTFKKNDECELMLTYDTPALLQTGSRNPTGQKTIPMIWGTYMKLVTKYQISAKDLSEMNYVNS
jgi:hypothetical protein